MRKIHLYGFLVSWRHFYKYQNVIVTELAFILLVKEESKCLY